MAHDPDLRLVQRQSAPLAGPAFDLLLLEFGVCAMSDAIARFGTLGRAILFAAAARACGPLDGATLRPARPVSINALAASLQRPFETTRRNANALIDMGLLARSAAGLHVPIQAMSLPQVEAFGDHCHDLLVRLIEDARAANLTLPAAREMACYDPRVGAGIAFDLLLAGFECRDGNDRNPMRTALLTTTEWANARFAGGGGTPYTATPVKPSMIARTLGLPYATVARNLDALVREGELERCADGLVVGKEQLGSAVTVAARQTLANRARQLIGRLAQAGFPAHQPACGYIRGRPALPALG